MQLIPYMYSLQQGGAVDAEMEALMQGSIANKLKGIIDEATSCLVEGEEHRKILEPNVVEDLVLIVETISHVLVLLSACHQMLKPIKADVSKKYKKKKGANVIAMPES